MYEIKKLTEKALQQNKNDRRTIYGHDNPKKPILINGEKNCKNRRASEFCESNIIK